MFEFFLFVLFVFGAVFGSFASVLIYRIKSEEKGIWTGRSHCTSCNKNLLGIDLVPIFSYVFNWGKCRQCKKKISSIYPLLEITMGIVFLSVGYFMVSFDGILMGNIGEISKLLFLLFLGFIVVVFSFYDILFMEIPEGILIAGVLAAFIVLSIQTLFPNIFFLTHFYGVSASLFQSVLAITIAASVILGLYAIMLKELDTVYDSMILLISLFLIIGYGEFLGVSILDIPILSGLISAYFLFLFFYLQIYVSGGAWLGGGDLRIAILMGLVLGANLIFYGVLATYISGSIIGIGLILYKKLIEKHKGRVNTMIPFGPFMGFGLLCTLFFQDFLVKLLQV